MRPIVVYLLGNWSLFIVRPRKGRDLKIHRQEVVAFGVTTNKTAGPYQ